MRFGKRFERVLLGMAVALVALGWCGGGAGGPESVKAAPTHSLREAFVPVSVLFTVVNMPAGAVILGCTDVGGPAVGYQSGCMLGYDSSDADVPVARLFRAARVGGSPATQYDAAVEHAIPGTLWFQRSGTGFTARFVVLEAN